MKRVVVVALGLFIISCGGKQEKAPTLKLRNFAAEREMFFSGLLHTPDETSINLIPGLAGFDSTILNDAELFFQYMGNDVKAASNLGIYLSDLNYCILFKQSTATKRYFKAAYELSQVIGIEKNILDFLAKRYADNIARNDSVKLVMEQLLKNSTSGLKGTNRERLAGIAMASYQIENLHLVLSELESFPKTLNEEQLQSQKMLFQYLLKQQGKFEITYNFIESYSDPLDPNKNPNYPFFNTALRELINVYHSVTKDDLKINELREIVNSIHTKIVKID